MSNSPITLQNSLKNINIIQGFFNIYKQLKNSVSYSQRHKIFKPLSASVQIFGESQTTMSRSQFLLRVKIPQFQYCSIMTSARHAGPPEDLVDQGNRRKKVPPCLSIIMKAVGILGFSCPLGGFKINFTIA